jgi:cytochrome c
VLTLTLAATGASAQTLAKKGEQVFQQCSGCHAVARGQKSLAGPHLAGVVGRKAAADRSFAGYTPALKKISTRTTWTPQQLDRFLANPAGVAPGTSMAFVKVAKPADRQAVIAYLQTKK